jgi:hypothetical protein
MRSASPAPREDQEPQRLDFAPNAVSWLWVENVAICGWSQPASAAIIDGLQAASEPHRQRYPRGLSFVHIGRVELTLMDADTRKAFVHVLRDLGASVAACAIVTHASGFRASAMRSVITGIVVLSRSPVEVRFHDHPEAVLEWLPEKHEQVTGVRIEADRLREAMLKLAGVLDDGPDLVNGV